MANNKDFKVKNGIQPAAYLEKVGTVTTTTTNYTFSNSVYTGKTLDLSNEDTAPECIFFSNDGTKLFTTGITNDSVYRYDLSTPWDITTATYNQSVSINTQEPAVKDVHFKPDGTKMFIIGSSSDDIHEYTLSTAWDLSTVSYSNNFLYVGPQDLVPYGLHFKPDGTKIFVIGASTTEVYEYDLSTAWTISTATYNSNSFDVSITGVNPGTGLAFNSDGTEMYVTDSSTDAIYKYDLTTAWDVTTASYSSSFDISAQEANVRNLFFKSDDTKFYIVGTTSDSVFEYRTSLTEATLDLSTGTAFEITPSSEIEINLSNPAASGTVSTATLVLHEDVLSEDDLSSAEYADKTVSLTSETYTETEPKGITFKPDGTKMYINGTSSDDVFQYSLSKPWDISTASQDFLGRVYAQNLNTRDLFFKPDGTVLFLADANSIRGATLNTAWDISSGIASTATTSLVTLGISGNDVVAIHFKDDGTKLYAAENDTTFRRVHQFSLSTAWDVTTLSADNVTFSVNSETGSGVSGLAFNSAGTKMYVVSWITDEIYQYDLTTAWDLSTASYNSVSFDLSNEDTAPYGCFIHPDGYYFYVLGDTNNSAFQYKMGQDCIISYNSSIQFNTGEAPTASALGQTNVLTFSTRDGGTTYQGTRTIEGAE